MSPLGSRAFTFSRGVLNGTISVYTFASRILRPISCVYWPPKSRMRIVSNFDDIAPHYSNRGEPHEKQVAVQENKKRSRNTCCTQHHKRLLRSRYVQESHDENGNERRRYHTFERHKYS